MQVVHVLKTKADYFEAVESGAKTFEVRRDDRGFQKGDLVKLVKLHREPNCDAIYSIYEGPNGEACAVSAAFFLVFRIGWILTGGQLGIEPGYVVFSLEKIE